MFNVENLLKALAKSSIYVIALLLLIVTAAYASDGSPLMQDVVPSTVVTVELTETSAPEVTPTPMMMATETPEPDLTEVMPTETIAPLPDPPYDSRDSLPDCDKSFDEITAEKQQTPVDLDAPVTCKLQYLEPTGDKGYAAGGVSISPGFGRVTTLDQGAENVGPAAVATSDPVYSWANQQLNCSWPCALPNPQIQALYGSVSAKQAWLSSGKSWNDYHFFNRMHILGGGSITCNMGGTSIVFSGTTGASIGLFQGRGVHGTYTGNMRLTWEKFLSNTDCDQIVTTTTVAQNAAVFMFIGSYLSGSTNHWYGQAWLNGTWASVFDVTTNTNPIYALESGQELAALNYDKNNIHIPTNFIHKYQIKYNGVIYPWEDEALHATLKNKSLVDLSHSSPFNIMDLQPGNFTSMVSDAL